MVQRSVRPSPHQIRTPNQIEQKELPFQKPDWTWEHESWFGWVWEELTKLEGRHENDDAFHTLRHLKQAMYVACHKVKQAKQTQIATTLGAQLSATMGLLGADENKNTKLVIQCCNTFPFLAGLIDPHDPALRIHPIIEQIRDRVVELATKQALRDQDTLDHSGPIPEHAHSNTRRISKSN